MTEIVDIASTVLYWVSLMIVVCVVPDLIRRERVGDAGAPMRSAADHAPQRLNEMDSKEHWRRVVISILSGLLFLSPVVLQRVYPQADAVAAQFTGIPGRFWWAYITLAFVCLVPAVAFFVAREFFLGYPALIRTFIERYYGVLLTIAAVFFLTSRIMRNTWSH
jgi:hypothetical protein